MGAITFIECDARGTFNHAIIALEEAGYDVRFENDNLTVVVDNEDDYQIVKFLVCCADCECPHRKTDCPDLDCHKIVRS
jgi:hypothetical protein